MHLRVPSMGALFFTVGLFAQLGCKADKPAPETKSKTTPASAAKTTAAAPSEAPPTKAPELKGNGEEWIPQEHELGQKKFKDPGVYVDGKFVGMLRFGELPTGLPIHWHEEEAPLEFKKGDKGPRTKMVKQRRYSFQEYLKKIGVDLKKVKELHIYGGAKKARAVIIKGDMLRKHKDFAFRFGSDVFGKPIPACPGPIADGNCPDNLRTVTVYVDKDPPGRIGGYFSFDGKEIIEGIPYYGRPLRGGVRVYLDGPFAAHIKRNKLEEEGKSFTVKLPDGAIRYNLFGFLKAQGVDTSKIAEAWLIHKDRRVKRIPKEDLPGLLFAAATRGSGQILVGADRVQTNAIALHTKPVNPKDIATPLPHELHDDRTL